MVAAVTTVTQQKSAPSSAGESTSGASASGSVRQSLRGQPFDVQEKALAPRAVQRDASTTANDVAPPPTGETIEQAIARWQPRLKRVTDPVSFMTSGAKGNYNAAVQNAKAKTGFFAQAKAELAALSAEFTGFAGETSAPQKAELAAMSTLCGAWSDMYGAIQSTGMSKEGAADPKARAKVHDRVRAVVDEAGAAWRGIESGALLEAAVVGAIGKAWDEISLFVDSWSDVSGTSGSTSASPYMWASFLQTVERYRSVLNQYGKLEERGGDASGTAKLAVKDSDAKKGMVKDGERFDEVAEQKGGGMAVALETYNYKVANTVEMKKQVAAMLARVEAGEFETAEKAVAAFRATIGAGLASEVFYEQVEQLARGAWHTQHGDELVNEGDAAAKKAYKCYKLSEDSRARSEKSLGKAEKAHDIHGEKAEEMDKFGADKAYDAVLTHKRNAEVLANDALAYANAGDAKKGTAHTKYAEAETELANAEVALGKVDAKRFPQLSPGVSDVQGKLGATKGKLAESKEAAAGLDLVSKQIQERAKNAKKIAGDYDPEKHEVKCPAAIEGASAEHYEKMSLSVFFKPVWFLTIEGGADFSWGTMHAAEGLKSFTEGSAHGTISVDVCIFTVEVGYEQTTRYEVDGLKDPITVDRLGSAEMAKWGAAKEIAEDGTETRLMGAFNDERAKMNQLYGGLAKAADRYAGGGDAGEFGQSVEAAIMLMKVAQGELRVGVMLNAAGGDWFKGAIEAKKLPDPAILEEDMRSLKQQPRTKAASEVGKQDEAHEALMSDSQEKADKAFRQMAGMKNDPTVSFKSTGAWHAGASIGGGGYGLGYKYTRTTTVSDGDGKYFDFEEEKSSIHEIGFESPWVDGKLKLVFEEEAWALEAEAEIKAHLGDEHDEKEVQNGLKQRLALLKGLLQGKTGAVAILNFGKKYIEDAIDETFSNLAKPKVETKNELTAEFGFAVKKSKKGWSGEFSVGFARKIEHEIDAGVVGGKASYAGGMKVTVPLF